jgi:hypothetical protein
MDIKYKLGRVHIPDQRDAQFPLSKALGQIKIIHESTKVRNYKYWWANGWWGDQGNTSQCVAYSWLHWLEDGPITHFYENRIKTKNRHHDPLYKPEVIYNEAKKVDEWEDENYDGTSVRAGAKILKKYGAIQEYRWATNAQEVIEAIQMIGPVVVGTWWHYNMFFPDENGIITATGSKVGGHAYVINGVNLKKGLFRIKNSWGKSWGKNGHAYISISDFDKLLKDYGEACVAFEKKLDL